MAETFLEEQVKRMREMAERVAEVRSQVLENAEAMERDRHAMYQSPLHDVRDLRTYQTHEPQLKRTHKANGSTPRRRRRR